jgi:predicted PurR-regulated permease PerM
MTADGAKCEPSRPRAGYHRRGRLWAEGRAMTTPLPAWDLTRILLAVVAVGGLIAASFWVLRPFLPAVIWATMIVVATWPALRAVEARLWGRRSLAVGVMTLGMLAVMAVPLTVAIVTIVDRADLVIGWMRSLAERPVPALPDWVVGLPLVGPRLATEWQKVASTRPEEIAGRVTPYLAGIVRWLIGQAGSLGALLVQLLLTVAVAAMLYARGETVARGVLAFARRLAGAAGERVVVLSAGAIRGVALGIVVTALVQAVVGGIGLAVTGVPHPLLLGSIMFLLAVAQVGPMPVLLGAVVWLYMSGQTVWAAVLLVWSLVIGTLDNFLRPVLIRTGADLPFVLIFAGVLGGMLAFGLIGLFVGPVVLAVTYTLLVAWVTEGDRPPV